ncbi:MAG: PilZ domain-containing protein [Pseudomonadota bacterium]
MNRRTSQRAKVDLLINRFLDGHPYVCRMTDISSTGLRLIPLLEPTSAPRYMGLQFQLPGVGAILTASGEAIEGSNPNMSAGTGVRFTRLPPESESVIRQFIASC